MNSANTNRDTLFHMEGLTGAEPVISPTEPEGYVTKELPPLLDRSVLKKNAPKRKRTLSPPRRVGNRPGVQMEYKGMRDGSPWGSYWKSFQVKYTDFVTVAVRKGGRRKCVVMIHGIRHDNIVTVLETFRHEGSFHVVLERIPISLVQIVASPPYPGEQELAAILGQILEALAYLSSRGLEHGSLGCSNILLSAEGDVKIADQECCRRVAPAGNTGVRDVRALGVIMMELMQKYVKEDGTVGIENLDRWPSDSAAVGFLSATTSTSSVQELLKHRLLQCDWRKDWLEWLVDWANVSAYRLHKPA
ncbi:hypothetical protein MMC13_001821 [Lambiella insularis]|nr:hypothetical protein [Lambiella insularis]